MSRAKVVIIEDEPDIIEVMSYNLKREGYQVSASRRGDEGLNLVRNQSPALVLLDLMLPGTDGLSICQQLKADPITRDIPIIIVSAKGEESDVVIGLGLGADDYIAKPFSPRELLARVKAVLRRGPVREDQQKERIQIKDLMIDTTRHEVVIAGVQVKLTATEFKLLFQLASQPGRAFSREQLLNRVVGEGVIVVDRNIDVHIRSVRKKLGVLSHMVQTIRGVGYRFMDD
ncbi:MAG: response regulator [Pseudomonadales bacterium]|jgi:DNA-binding response OmpR family regulator|nr:response regulator [Pseudomonadales bacterium]MDP4639446.1 response regulator [Pseudomonadales bacterium]MDP4764715.1 response regulator [Pseudomonadales bacterium]MDP4876376.1 response regulator [Pseudomonadales bacterium]MDP4911917.1 response regulator [Pseudomonadales bacterium]